MEERWDDRCRAELEVELEVGAVNNCDGEVDDANSVCGSSNGEALPSSSPEKLPEALETPPCSA